MKFTVTPHALGRDVLTRDPMATLARGSRHIVQRLGDYDVRPAIEADVEDAHDACEVAWMRYQNIDEDRQTPDRKRSLMTGDMVKVEDEAGAATWWICCSIGWTETIAPGDVRVEVEAPDADDE
jgi:hypothetical protein